MFTSVDSSRAHEFYTHCRHWLNVCFNLIDLYLRLTTWLNAHF